MFRFADLVGTYRLVVSEELLAFVERAFVERAQPNERARVREEALDEARKSELSIEADGTIASRAGNAEFYRVKVAFDDALLEAFHFEKPDASPVSLVLLDGGRVTAHQPGKPPAEFRKLTV
ncbi:MAG TPA: hypothetical protein VF103_08045 [Polyangiaceae bacterium]